MVHFSMAGAAEGPSPPEPDEPGYDYSILIEGWVLARSVYLHRVGSNGRIREGVRDRYGRRLVLSTDADLHDFHALVQVEFAESPGHFAFVARDDQGKVRGRRDFWIWRSEREQAEVIFAARPSPMEALEQARDAEIRRREAAEQALAASRAEAAALARRFAELEARVAAQAKRTKRLRKKAALAATPSGRREPRRSVDPPRAEAHRAGADDTEPPRGADSSGRSGQRGAEVVRELVGEITEMYRLMRSPPVDEHRNPRLFGEHLPIVSRMTSRAA